MENNQKYLPIHSFWNLSNEQKQEVDVDSKKRTDEKVLQVSLCYPDGGCFNGTQFVSWR